MGFEIPAYEENRIFEVKSVVGFYRASLLKFVRSFNGLKSCLRPRMVFRLRNVYVPLHADHKWRLV